MTTICYAGAPPHRSPVGRVVPCDPAQRLERRRLLSWLLLWIVVANTGYALLWLVGSPPRPMVIIVTSVAGLLVRAMPVTVKRAAFVCTTLYSVTVFISQLFNIAPTRIIGSMAILPETTFTTSPDYRVAGAGVLVTIAVAMGVATRDMAFRRGSSLLIAIAASLAWSGMDLAVSRWDGGIYATTPPPGPFQSAVSLSGFAANPTGDRHLVLIDVEAMGLPRDPALLRRLFARLQTSALRRRVSITQGSTFFFGPTVNSEIRELCGRWGDNQSLLVATDAQCLPMRLRRRGYDTTALHGFSAAMYDRARWYPHAGFQRMRFRDSLITPGQPGCPGVFPGACDRAVPAIIARQLKAARTPQFIHWMTLNSHYPVPVLAALHTDHCEAFDPALAARAPMACRMFRIWDDLFASLAHQMLAPDWPPTDVLIVGDHRPPFYDRRQRALFAPDQVPWILLRAHAGMAQHPLSTPPGAPMITSPLPRG